MLSAVRTPSGVIETVSAEDAEFVQLTLNDKIFEAYNLSLGNDGEPVALPFEGGTVRLSSKEGEPLIMLPLWRHRFCIDQREHI